MGRNLIYCLVCNHNTLKNKGISYHKFPKNPNLCKKWRQICGCMEYDDVSNAAICSVHFAPENKKIMTRDGKSIVILNPWTIPSISVPHPPQSTYSFPPRTLTKPSISSIPIFNNSQSDSSNANELDGPSQSVLNCDSNSSASYVETASSQINESKTDCKDSLMPILLSISCESSDHELTKLSDDELLASDEENVKTNSEEHDKNIGTPPSKKRRYYEPRYLGEIELSDFSSPRKGARTLKIIQKKFREMSQKIRVLQNQNQYLKNRMEVLKDVMPHLKEEDCILSETVTFNQEGTET